MKQVIDGHLRFCNIAGQVKAGQDSLTMIVKGAFQLNPNGKSTILEGDDLAQPMGDLFYQENDKASVTYASDFCLFKHHADMTLTGTCYTPNGSEIAGTQVTFGVGNWRKSLAVFGDRYWVGNKPSQPIPFTNMPIIYENAYGGFGYDKNPVGKGIRAITLPTGQFLHPLPNIEDPNHFVSAPSQQPLPAGFAPLQPGWGTRPTPKGTYDKKYLKKNWPYFPDDFDWRHFNSAPQNQQFSQYLQGDETLYFENMHPEVTQYSSQLPAIRPRLFVTTAPNKLHEIPLNLDTLSVNMDEEKLVLVWRGLLGVPSESFAEDTLFFLADEDMSQPQPIEYYQQKLVELNDEKAAEFDLEPEEAEPVVEEPDSEEDAAFAKEMAKMFDQVKAQMKEANAPDELIGMIGMDMDHEAFSAKFAELFNLDLDKGQQFLKESQEAQKLQIKEALIEAGEDPAILDELEQSDEDIDSGWSEQSLRERLESGQGFAEQELQGVDMSGWDLSGVNFHNADLSQAKLVNCNFTNANLSGAILTAADLTNCVAIDAIFDDAIVENANLSRSDLTSVSAKAGLFIGAQLVKVILTQADLTDADFTDAVLAGCNLAEAELSGCIFDKADLSLANLTKAKGKRISFTEARLKEADFSEAVFEEASFVEADLHLANFDNAIMTNSTFESVQAESITMVGANLTGLRAGEGSNFRHGVFRSVNAEGSSWVGADLSGADFSQAILNNADFTESNLTAAILTRVSLKASNFTNAIMIGSNLSKSNLFQSNLEGANLTQADISNSNLYGSEVWKSIIQGANLKGTNIKKTKFEIKEFFEL
ncbi:DUF2169 domain-containing protein [Alteromonadaceae bacterium BrNp21-10]|nr:DUF2169 domain-containing protein [Alteromonadaceae bacterium BrNp21-10]